MAKRLAWVAGCALLVAMIGCSPVMKAHIELGRGNYKEAIGLYEAYLAENPDSFQVRSYLGYAYLKVDRVDEAVKTLEMALKQNPEDAHTILYLGMARVKKGDCKGAVEIWQGYRNPEKPFVEREIRRQMTLLQIAEGHRMAKHALANEAQLQGITAPPNTIAVLEYQDMTTDNSFAAHRKALGAMIISDLSKIKAIKVVERIQLQALLAEMKLGQSGVVEASSAPRVGHLIGAKHFLVGTLMKGSLSVATTVGDKTSTATVVEADFWRIPPVAVKTAAEALGVTLKEEEWAAVSRPHTKNLEAFTDYGKGLIALDAGKWDEARALFYKAYKADPNFLLAKEAYYSCPGKNTQSLVAILEMTPVQRVEAIEGAIKLAEAAQAEANKDAGQGGGDG